MNILLTCLVFCIFMIVWRLSSRFRARRWSMSCVAKSGALKERRRIQSAEVRWDCTPSVGERCEVREAKLFLSFSGRAFLRGNISTRHEHTGPFTISRIGTCARLHFGRLAPYRARNITLCNDSASIAILDCFKKQKCLKVNFIYDMINDK